MRTQPNRQPAGTPAGGQFAPSTNPGAEVELDDLDPAAMRRVELVTKATVMGPLQTAAATGRPSRQQEEWEAYCASMRERLADAPPDVRQAVDALTTVAPEPAGWGDRRPYIEVPDLPGRPEIRWADDATPSSWIAGQMSYAEAYDLGLIEQMHLGFETPEYLHARELDRRKADRTALSALAAAVEEGPQGIAADPDRYFDALQEMSEPRNEGRSAQARALIAQAAQRSGLREDALVLAAADDELRTIPTNIGSPKEQRLRAEVRRALHDGLRNAPGVSGSIPFDAAIEHAIEACDGPLRRRSAVRAIAEEQMAAARQAGERRVGEVLSSRAGIDGEITVPPYSTAKVVNEGFPTFERSKRPLTPVEKAMIVAWWDGDRTSASFPGALHSWRPEG